MKTALRTFFSLCAMLVWAFSCSPNITRDPFTLVKVVPENPSILNPLLATEMGAFEVYFYVYDSLLEFDSELKLRPSLAESWESSPDHLEFTFRLKGNVVWHDGRPFTADDVVFTFDAIRDKRVDAAHLRGYYDDIEAVEKIDDYTVKFRCKRPYFKIESTFAITKIIPKHIFEDLDVFNANPANRSPVGTGPYRFVSWQTGRRIELTRFEGYHGKPPDIKKIVFKIVPDKTTTFALLKKNAIDQSEVTPIQWKFQTEGTAFTDNFTKHMYYPPNYSFIAWNLRKPIFSDKRVRAAMAMMIDKEKILKNVMFGLGETVTGPFYRYGLNYDEGVKPIPCDPAGARKLLGEAGWVDTDGDGILEKDGVEFRFSILIRAGERLSRSISLMLMDELQRSGVKMEIVQLEWPTLVGFVMKRDFDAVFLMFAIPVVEDVYPVWHSSNAEKGSNFFGLKNPVVDRLCEEARGEFDPEKRAVLYKEVHSVIADEQPVAFMFTLPTLLTVAKRFENVIDYRMAPDMMEWKVGPGPVLKEW